MSKFDVMAVTMIVERMRVNSALWHGASEDERAKLTRANRALADALREAYGVPVIYCAESGVWYLDHIGGTRLYDVY